MRYLISPARYSICWADNHLGLFDEGAEMYDGISDDYMGFRCSI